VAPDVARDPAGRPDVVVAADPADVLVPRPDADEGRSGRVGDDLLGLVDVDDVLRPARDRGTEGGHRDGLSLDRLERVALLDPAVVATIEQPNVVDAGVPKDQRGARRRDLPGPPAGPLLVRIAFGVAAVQDDRRRRRDAERTNGLVEHLR